jgi:hypothetical protein
MPAGDTGLPAALRGVSGPTSNLSDRRLHAVTLLVCIELAGALMELVGEVHSGGGDGADLPPVLWWARFGPPD